jgi:predicted acetyltransferase
LIVPTLDLRESFLGLAREYVAEGEQTGFAAALADFPAYVRRTELDACGEALLDGYVPRSHFWLVRDGLVIGTSRVRHWLTKYLENEVGHIGYDVGPKVRRLGYGRKLLTMTLAEARTLGVSRVRVVCDSDNAASVRVIERCGGTLDGEVLSTLTGRMVRQYWFLP